MRSPLAALAAVALYVGVCPLSAAGAQTPGDDPPKVIKFDSAQKSKASEALKLFAWGLLCERDDRLLEALQAYEKSAQLDPTAFAVQKKLLTFYVALDRGADALRVCEKLLELRPKDARAWHVYAKQLRHQGKAAEAVAALEKGLTFLDTDDLELGQQMYYERGSLQVDQKQPLLAAASFLESAKLLHRALQELHLEPFQEKEIQSRLAYLYERSGKIYLEAKDYDRAAASYRAAEKIDPLGGDRWHLSLAHTYRAQGKLTDALRSADLYLKLQPQGVEAYELKIDLLKKLGRAGEIVPWLEEAAAKDRYNVNLKMLLGDQYTQRNQFAKAEQVYLQLAKDSPSGAGYLKLLQNYRRANMLHKAVELIDQRIGQVEGKDLAVSNDAKAQVKSIIAALKEDPALARDLLKTAVPLLNGPKDLHGQTTYLLGVLADQHEDVKGAEAFYRAALKKVTPQTEGVIYGGLLRVLWKAKKYEDMVAVCQKGLKQAEATNQLLFYQELALAYAQLDRSSDALEAADRAVQLAPESNRLAAHGLRVRLLTKAQDYAKAEAECLKLLREHKQPGDVVRIRMLLANVYSAWQNYPKAENELQLVLKADPTNATAYNDLGYLWADKGKNLRQAEEMIRRALELDREQRKTITSPHVDPEQDNAAFVDSLGWVLFRLGRVEEARQELERATKLSGGDDPVIWEHLGDVYYRLKRIGEAHECWQKALTLYEVERARPLDQHYKDLKEKIQLLKSPSP